MIMTLPSSVEEPDNISRRSLHRRHSPEFKATVVADYYNATTAEERGSVLRRAGVHRSQVYEWRKTAQVSEPQPSRRPKRSSEQIEMDKLRARNAGLETELARTRLALEITGKAHALLEMLSASADNETPSQT
jgi:transposase